MEVFVTSFAAVHITAKFLVIFRIQKTSSFTSMLESPEVLTIMSLFILAEGDIPYWTNMDFFAPS
uniref:Uncharacterized protein n=1 Tax=Lepeophtheirus salmonis TaxID=72036 RepID=A0A0K2TJ42_LEPSM